MMGHLESDGFIWAKWKMNVFGISIFKQNRMSLTLTVEAPITTAADDILKYFFIVFQRK